MLLVPRVTVKNLKDMFTTDLVVYHILNRWPMQICHRYDIDIYTTGQQKKFNQRSGHFFVGYLFSETENNNHFIG